MQVKQARNIFQELSIIALILIAFTCFVSFSQELKSPNFERNKTERSFEKEAAHHSKLLLVNAPVVYFYLKEQRYKRFYEDFIQFLRSSILPEAPKTVKVYYSIIRHLFFRKHQSILYPFHSIW